ncbi:Auxilin-related protein 1 [Quillaja saponaria]|uniref:Auxilin-related protein 1 n=1 Tax=Quillaja saponaria TaxID=32244 RepID=A0AAD7PIQ4_QUISA|nr:Auxilin-related protein 1 [Quillaja saponaria]
MSKRTNRRRIPLDPLFSITSGLSLRFLFLHCSSIIYLHKNKAIMNDFDGILATDFGFKPQGKSAPMAASKGSSNINAGGSLNFDPEPRGASRSTLNSNSFSGSFMDDGNSSLFGSSGSQKNHDAGGLGDLFGGSARYTSKSESRGGDASFNFDSMFSGSNDLGAKSTDSPPVYDKPVYDDDIFDGVPGIKSSTKIKYDDVFASVSSAPGGSDAAFDDLLAGFGKAEHEAKSSSRKRSEKGEKGVSGFDDLLPGFGRSSSPSDRPKSEAGMSSEPTTGASKKNSNVMEDPFKVFESSSHPASSSSRNFTDPLEEISKLNRSASTRVDSSPVSNGKLYDDVDPFDGLGKSVPAFSLERNSRSDRNPSRSDTTSSWTRTYTDKEPIQKSSVGSPERGSQKKIYHDQEFHQTPINVHTYSSSDSNKPIGKTTSLPSFDNTSSEDANIQVDMSPKYEENLESTDDAWLTVSEIPLFTEPTSAPPPSRPPPPRPVQVLKSVAGSSGSTRKKANQISSFPSSNQFSQVPQSAPSTSTASPLDDLEDFAVGRNPSNDEQTNSRHSEELEMNSVAAAMKEAMDRAEAEFRHAKEVRERESTKAARSKEAAQLEKEGMQDEREKQERFDREEKEREQWRLERERERAREIEREREKARQAVGRATREARERAAAEARSRAERAAVEKAHAEARERAERVAVLRAQAEARERAAAEAKERAERAAAEARERANTEGKEKEARERATAARAEARVRGERAAVERAAAEAQDRAASAARVNQQKNEDDLESFFSMGRASSAPRPRASSSNRQEPDAMKKSGGASSNIRKASSSTNIVDDLSSIFGGSTSAGGFLEVEGETEDRRRSRLERHQRAEERAQKALAEKNQRDLQTQREQAERHRIAETLDVEIKRWAAGKEGNLRAILSTLQYVLWPECGWQPVSLTDLITAASVKKVYRKATLCIHPDKVQQKGANLQQKYIAEKVFDLLKEAWNKFNSEELF